MKAISRSRFIDWLKPLQFAIFAHPIISKRTFAVVYINHQLTLHIDVRHKRICLNTFSNSDSRSLYSSEASDLNDVPVVKVSVHIPDNSSNPIIAIYWDDSSKCNRFREHSERSTVKAEIEAVSLALKQAIFQMNLPRIHIVTNSKFVWNNFGKTSLCWSLDEFLQQKSMIFSFCFAEAEDLYRLLHMIDATIEYNSLIDERTERFRRNLMNEKISEQESCLVSKNESISQTSSIKAILAKEKKKSSGVFVQKRSSEVNSKNYASENLLNNDNVPIVYTCGVLRIEGNEKKYMKAGYGVYWPHAQELGIGKRYNFFPITLVRCQLQAIIDALQQAVEQNYQNIVLRTDCVSFLVHHPRQWLKANGSHVRYYDQYLRIMDLCKDVKVRFRPANDRVALSEAEALAESGVCLPIPSRRSRKNMYNSKTPSITNIKCSA